MRQEFKNSFIIAFPRCNPFTVSGHKMSLYQTTDKNVSYSLIRGRSLKTLLLMHFTVYTFSSKMDTRLVLDAARFSIKTFVVVTVERL